MLKGRLTYSIIKKRKVFGKGVNEMQRAMKLNAAAKSTAKRIKKGAAHVGKKVRRGL